MPIWRGLVVAGVLTAAGGACSSSGKSNDGGTADSIVQCRTTDDCPSIEQPPTAGGCFANKPGGVCTRCDIRMLCPTGTECIPDPVDTMVCARPCTSDANCNPGMFCRDSYCRQRTCADGGTCPAPYACRNDVCVRPPCGDDAGTCPAPLACGGAFCVEP